MTDMVMVQCPNTDKAVPAKDEVAGCDGVFQLNIIRRLIAETPLAAASAGVGRADGSSGCKLGTKYGAKS
jgi:hypothetical protein